MSEPITPERVRGLLDAATPGPWRTEAYGDYGWWVDGVDVTAGDGEQGHANGLLIAAAPDIAAAYIEQAAEVERLTRERDEAREIDEAFTEQALQGGDCGVLVASTVQRMLGHSSCRMGTSRLEETAAHFEAEYDNAVAENERLTRERDEERRDAASIYSVRQTEIDREHVRRVKAEAEVERLTAQVRSMAGLLDWWNQRALEAEAEVAERESQITRLELKIAGES